MAAGDYVIRRNNANTDTIPNAGSTLDLLWDTSVATNGSIISYTASTGVFTLSEAGHYLVMYSDQYGTTSTTNNERLNVRSTLFLDDGGTGTFSRIEPGNGTGYIRKNSGSQEYINYGCGIIDVSANSDLKVQYERIDNTVGTGEEPDRVANDRSGIHILKLSDDLNYGRYESSANTSTSATDGTVNQINLQSTVEQDTPFTRTTNSIDIATTNPVLVLYSLRAEFGAGGRSEFQSFLRLNGTTLINRSINQTYIRAADGANWGGMSGSALINPTSGDDLDLVVISREAGGESFRATVQLVELPTTTKQAITTQDTETGNLNAANTAFNYGTSDTIDTDVFTYTATNTNIDVDVAGDYLAFAGLGTTVANAATRAVPAISFTVEGTELQTAGNSTYIRNSGTAEFGAMQIGAILNGLSVNDSIRVLADRIGTNTGTVTGVGGLQLIQMSSIVPSTGETFTLVDSGGASYTLTGGDLTFDIDNAEFLVANAGSFTLTGGDATFEVDNPNKDLTAEAGAFALTGGAATLFAGELTGIEYKIEAEPAEYTLSGGQAYIARTCAAADLGFTDDYVIIGAASDDFDCEAVTGWTQAGSATGTLSTSTEQVIQGTTSIELRGANGVGTYTHDIGVGDGWSITDTTLYFWFYYAKGKSAAILTSTADAVVIRLFFGGTTDFADYQCTASGDEELINGFQLLSASGKNTRGGTFNFTDTDANWNREIRRVQLRLNYTAAGNDATGGLTPEPPIFMDCWFTGSTIRVEGGTRNAPKTFEQLRDYSAIAGSRDSSSATSFPLGVVEVNNAEVTLQTGVQVGNGTCNGWLATEGKSIFINQGSPETKNPIVIDANSGITLGEKESGQRNYAVRGNIVFQTDSAQADFQVKDRGAAEIYDTKFFKFRNLFFGDSTDTDSIIDLNRVTVDTSETAYFYSKNLFLEDVEIYNCRENLTNYAAVISESPKSSSNILLHDNNEGVFINNTITIEELKCQDNTNFDIVLLEGDSATVVNSVFDENKLKRVT